MTVRILRRYGTETAEYAQVEMPDGSRMEFKSRDKNAPDDAFLAMADAYWQAQHVEPETIIEIEAEDGTII